MPAGRSLSRKKGQEGQTSTIRSKRGRGGGRLVIPIGAGRIPDPAQQVSAVGERATKDGALAIEPIGPEPVRNCPLLIRRSRQDHTHGSGSADGERNAGGAGRAAAHVGTSAIAERGKPVGIRERRPALAKVRPQSSRRAEIDQRREA